MIFLVLIMNKPIIIIWKFIIDSYLVPEYIPREAIITPLLLPKYH